MSGPNIILEPKLMFHTLQEMEKETKDILKSIHALAHVLQSVSGLTYAIGFGDLIKQAEKDFNHFGSAMVAATNAVNIACSEVVNQLVAKFASQGAKSSYDAPLYEEVDITTHIADLVAIYPPVMKKHFDDLFQKIYHFGNLFAHMEQTFGKTKNFWIGASADKIRSNFMTRIDPKFGELLQVLYQIHNHGMEWIDEAVKFEASLSTP